MSERTDDPGFQDYSWTDDVNHTLGPLEAGIGTSPATPGDDASGASDANHPIGPDTSIIRAPKEGEGGWNSRMPYNKYMEIPAVQALSGASEGIVRGIGLKVHPSLDADTPVEEKFSELTKTWHPGLDVPKAAVMAIKRFSGTPLNPEEQRTMYEGMAGAAAPFVRSPIRRMWNTWDMGSKVIGSGKTILDQ